MTLLNFCSHALWWKNWNLPFTFLWIKLLNCLHDSQSLVPPLDTANALPASAFIIIKRQKNVGLKFRFPDKTLNKLSRHLEWSGNHSCQIPPNNECSQSAVPKIIKMANFTETLKLSKILLQIFKFYLNIDSSTCQKF